MSSIIACGSERPPSVSSSSMLSNCAESLLPGTMIGWSRSSVPPNFADCSRLRREFIQLRLPCTVLISPLCAMKRNGCARSHVGKVLVEKRECTTAMALTNSGSRRSP